MSNLLELKDETTAVDLGPDPVDPAHLRGGANWFYWIAGLSAINSAIFAFGGNTAFIAGLGFTQLADGVIDLSIQQGGPSVLKAVAVVFDIILIIVFALFGYFANKRFSAAFIVGILIYAADALLLLVLGAFLTAGFHAFALFFIIRGFLACRKINAAESSRVFQTMPLPPPPPSF